MISNAKHSKFLFKFPKNFFPVHIQKKYELYLAKNKSPFTSFTEFMNHTIQGVSFPAIDIETTPTQNTGVRIPPAFRGSLPAEQYLDRSFTIQFKHIEGFINYYAILETILWTYSEENTQEFLPALYVKMLNNESQEILHIKMDRLIFKGAPGGLALSYGDVRNTAANFNIILQWNDFDILVDFDTENSISKDILHQ